MISQVLDFRITKIIPETHEASTFVLEEIGGKKVFYKAGQFITFIFQLNGFEVRRSYSLSSAPGVDKQISITVKRVRNGQVSRYLLDHCRAGDILTALAPSGKFVPDKQITAQSDIFLLAAGSGIIPVYALLRDILHHSPGVSVILVYQNHTERDTIFRKELEQMAIQYAHRFTWLDFVSVPHSPLRSSRRLNNEQLETIISEKVGINRSNAKFFVCGPTAFMRMCQFTILLMGFDEEQIRKEFFVIDEPPPPPLIEDIRPRRVTVHAGDQMLTFTIEYPQTILQSALDQSIALPYSCRGGRCSTCVAKCLEGEIKMSVNDVLTQNDLAQGLVLTCVGYAASDIELAFDNK
ncbi:iron-sulfur cluster-binding domain-containing protein [Agriterribacter sp.]|uniref:flavin reductase family protein n=1 Tax=Agriterribacter sp. TaxID=2821509 RepID=UPI002B9BBEFB|nr:iron-sulfur cluster-binding domain-containing protein [Agriterribacter sp.]HRP57677.1 iron-sulfur cluster-binding domain-containing protein [Agriterribacter sp.]